jgi:putative heme-binding domain-containing protein
MVLLAFHVGTGSAIAQHESAGAIEEGRTIYGAVCANCHGPDGDGISGINFGRGQFRRPYSDAELNNIVRKGIPGTPMPPTDVPEAQAARVVAYLRSMATALNGGSGGGDPVRGQALFEGKGACTTCHAVNGRGSRVGPDLSQIGSMRRATELQTSLVDPAAEVLPQNRFFRVVTADGTTVTGRLLNQDTFTVQLLDATEHLRSFDKSTLRSQGFTDTIMPSYRDKLDPRELADLVGYLASLKRR